MSKSQVKDQIGRPLNEGDIVFIVGTSETGIVLGKTPNRRTMVDVKWRDEQITSFYGTSLFLRKSAH